MSFIKWLNNSFKLQDDRGIARKVLSEITMHKYSKSLPVSQFYELRLVSNLKLVNDRGIARKFFFRNHYAQGQ